MSETLISTILVIVGLINFTPVVGLRSGFFLAQAYGIEEPTGNVLILLRHRAAMFGIVGGLIIAAALFPALQVAAVVVAYASMLSFVVLAMGQGGYGEQIRKVVIIDLGAILLLSVVPIIWMLG